MRNIGDIWGVSESTLRTLVEARYRRASTPDDGHAAEPMAGDAVLPQADHVLQKSVEIDAPPAAVWPWICQLYRGGGVYGWTGVETDRCRSADYLLGNTQPPRRGDRFDHFLVIESVTPGESVVWKALTRFSALGFEIPAMSLEYRLAPCGPGRSTLAIRMRGACPGITATVADYLFGTLDFLLLSAQAQRLKDCVEGHAQRQALGLTNRGRVKLHQALAFIPAPGNTARAG